MTKMVIMEKRLSKREVQKAVEGAYKDNFKICYKRGQIYLYFPKKDLNDLQAAKISRQLRMSIISKSQVRVVIGY